MSVRARMFVQTVARNAGDTATVTLQAVSRGKENSAWSKFTPAGNLNMTLSREASGARQFFLDNIGKEVYLDISLAEDPICTECHETILPIPDDHADVGTGVHSGAEGYVPDEYVHNRCLAAAKERLGIS